MKKLVLLISILAGFSMQSLAYDFQSGSLLYTINSIHPTEVGVVGHVDGTAAQGELVIPETVTYEGVTYTVTIIGKRAFSGCRLLTGTLVIPNSVEEIMGAAFYECVGFTGDLVIPNSVTKINVDVSMENTVPGAFENCTGFDGRLILSNSLEIIGDAQGGGCFRGCNNLQGELLLPNTLAYIGESAFQFCTSLTGTLVIPESVTEIRSHAFESCRGIEDIVFPNTSFTKGSSLFSGCTGLTRITLPEGWTSTGDNIFSYCTGLNEVHLPESLTLIESNAFSNCTNLATVNFPDGLKVISIYAFGNCVALESVAFPSNLELICHNAFSNCTGLSDTLVVPVKELQWGAFKSCTSIRHLVLGEQLNSVSEAAFENTNIETLTIKAAVPPVLASPGSWQFDRDLPVTVPCGTLEAYQNAEGWNNFTNITEDCSEDIPLSGSEWYYEILNDDGSITYQYLQCAGDTTINEERPKVLVRSNTQYDRGETTEVTHEYIYEQNGIVYWWNKTLEEFTILYDLTANAGDEWEIKVGTESIIMHVDAVDYYDYEGHTYRMLHVSDSADIFSGDIVCGIGHLTSFFPERLMTRGRGYRVEGMRCYWIDGDLVFKLGDRDCDEVYEQLHNGIEEPGENGPSTGSRTLTVYPNPTNGILFVETRLIASLPEKTEYHITNLTGQTLLQGHITDETQQINIETLPRGMYFLHVGTQTVKFVVR